MMWTRSEVFDAAIRFLGGTGGDDYVDGWKAARSPGIVHVMDPDQMLSLKARGVGVMVMGGYRILSESGVVLKDVDFVRPVH